MRFPYATKREHGSALLIVLWSMVLLGVAVVSVLHSSRLDLRVVKNYGDTVQARYLALAGVEKTKALLHREMQELYSDRRSHSEDLLDNARELQDVPLGRGIFRVLREGDDGRGIAFGASDECAKLAVNAAKAEELQRLPDFPPEVAASIVDWRDSDDRASGDGAEVEYYAQLDPPYRPRNAPFETVRELLMVRGVTPELLLGEDTNANGLLDPEENDGAESDPVDNRDGRLDAGWLANITLDAHASNLGLDGEPRVNVTRATAEELVEAGMDQEAADAVVAHSNRTGGSGLGFLFDVRAQNNNGNNGNNNAGNNNGGNNNGGNNRVGNNNAPNNNAPNNNGQPNNGGNNGGNNNNGGAAVFSTEGLIELADKLTTHEGTTIPGAININTAPAIVLEALPDVTEEIAAAIIEYRDQNGYFKNVAELLNVANIDVDLFKKIGGRVAVRTATFRILAEGEVPSTGARQRVEVVVRYEPTGFDVLSWREDL